jgi:hypothetical protein
MSDSEPEEFEIHKEINKLNEDAFRKLIVNFFKRQRIHAVETHGSDERGVDIEARIDQDIFNRTCVVFIQVKAGNVGMTEWHEKICGQLTSLFYRQPIDSTINPATSRRILFITTGRILNKVNDEIKDWNSRVPIPIESFDGQDFVHLLSVNNHTAEEVRNLLAEPTLKPAAPPETGNLRNPVSDQREERRLHLHRIGQHKDSKDA